MSATHAKKQSKTTSEKKASSSVIKDDKIFNLHHTDFYNMIEPAFTAEGVQYYNFKKDSTMRYMRYVFMQNFLQEVDLRISLDDLRKQNEQMTAWLDGTKGVTNHGKVLEMLSIQRQQINLAFEPETIFRLASCIFFDDKEDLRSWDKKHNEEKITRWKESHTIDFFFNKLFQELTGLRDFSKDVLVSYLEKVPEVLKGWRLQEDILSR